MPVLVAIVVGAPEPVLAPINVGAPPQVAIVIGEPPHVAIGEPEPVLAPIKKAKANTAKVTVNKSLFMTKERSSGF